tara:strand:- start:57 stop:203 length:147 start_codon:yes stop_codon:yes gene_type:complete
MTNSKKGSHKLTESQLITIKDRIKSWKTKDQIIDMLRYRYGQMEEKAA